jgi:hypothetical protein
MVLGAYPKSKQVPIARVTINRAHLMLSSTKMM